MKRLLIPAFLFLSTPVLAAEPQFPPATLLQADIERMLKDINDLVGEYQKQANELRAYAAKCGDQPGCFLPVPEKKE